MSKTSIGPDQHARIQAAAAKLAKNERDEKDAKEFAQRRGRNDDTTSVKTNSVLTLQPHLVNEAGPAMQWDKKFGEAALDKDALRAQYLGDVRAGRGSKSNLITSANGRSSPLPPEVSNRDLPALPKSERGESRSPARIDTKPTEASVTPVPWPNDSPTQTPLPQQQSFPVPVTQEQPTPIEETPFATPLPIPDEKSVQSGTTPNQHPALRKAVPERKPVMAPQPQTRVSEDHGAAPGKKVSPNKLKKKEGGGFRKLFGRKKTETPSAVAATAPADDSYFQASDALRSTSRLDDHQSNVREPSPTYTDDQPEPVQAPSPKYEPSPAASSGFAEPSQAGGPVAGGPATQQEIDQAFSRFDQGPMEDMPAFAPADDESEDDAAAAPTVPRRQLQQTNPGTPTQRAPEYADDISEESVEFTKQQSPSQDRWAQIRKNAAERAARLSEEQVRRSRSQSQSQRTDEGETSGEETIESRVARIKARVAELTGNVDGQPAAAGPSGRQW
jgi:hypothetical protein